MRAASSICSGRARTRMSPVRLRQRTVPVRSTRNSAGRAMSWPCLDRRLCGGCRIGVIVSAFRIGEQREGVAGFLAEIARLLGRVDADRNRLDAGGAEFGEMLFDTP